MGEGADLGGESLLASLLIDCPSSIAHRRCVCITGQREYNTNVETTLDENVSLSLSQIQ